ncbi:MAG: NAD(P)/FAD-dependent oxidoreductase [Candidatus Delongbacteria bacterium]|nr:NAD(P)/FAD-dependent oxidoreductase [Candidatus Delongbacteria bacterium]MBN2837015.1 NAD(P)/FAD-dependent oxidoreductase [Candidatus Delongbacteria bacterium]
MDKVYDIAIIGAGPVGLFGSFYAGMRGLKAIVLESRDEVGGALTAVYPDKYIYDMVGFPKIQAKELIKNLDAQSSHFDENEMRLSTKVDDIIKNSDGTFLLSLNGGEEIVSRTVLITTGMGAFTPRKLPVKGIEKYEAQENSGIRYIIKDKYNYYGQNVVVVGGGNSALDWAHDFDGNSKSVSLVHMLNEWQAHEESITKLPQTGIKVYQPHVVKELKGEEKLEAVVIENTETKELTEIKAELLLVNIGFLPSKMKFDKLGLEFKGADILVDPVSMESTTVPGVFVAGDACTFDGKLKLICVGSAEAAIAVNHAVKRLDSSASLKPKFSSSFFTEDFNDKKK